MTLSSLRFAAIAVAITLPYAAVTARPAGRPGSPRQGSETADGQASRLRAALTELRKKDRATLGDLAEALAASERNASKLEQADGKLRQENSKLAIELKKAWEQAKAVERQNREHQEQLAALKQKTNALEAHLAEAAAKSEGELAEQRILLKRQLEAQRLASLRAEAEREDERARARQELAEQRAKMERELEHKTAAAEAAKNSAAEIEKLLQPLIAELQETKKTPAADLQKLAEGEAAKAKLAAAQTELAVLHSAIGIEKERCARLGQRLSEAKAEIDAHKELVTKTHAEFIAEQAQRMTLEKRAADLEKQLAAATAKPARPVALSVLRFDRNADETLRDREKLLAEVKKVISEQAGSQFDIVGHTCNTGNTKANLYLSLRRAETVRDMLVTGGVDDEVLHLRGAGETEPVADNSTSDGRRLNRRVEVVVREP